VLLSTVGERAWQVQVRAWLHRAGFVTYHTFDSRKSEPGFPDIIAILPGVRLIAIELKQDRGRVTTSQLYWLELFRSIEVYAEVWRPRDADMIQAQIESWRRQGITARY
jgi:hypothetical protein